MFFMPIRLAKKKKISKLSFKLMLHDRELLYSKKYIQFILGKIEVFFKILHLQWELLFFGFLSSTSFFLFGWIATANKQHFLKMRV
jgi:hypothetical protein